MLWLPRRLPTLHCETYANDTTMNEDKQCLQRDVTESRCLEEGCGKNMLDVCCDLPAFLTTTNTNTTITLQHDSNQHVRVGALQSHHPGCDYTPVGPGKDFHGTRGLLRRKAVGGLASHATYDTTSDDRTTRTGLESIVFAKQEQFTLSS